MYRESKIRKIILDGVEYLLIPVEEEFVGKKFVREYLGISHTTVYRKPWLFPDFGKAMESVERPYRRKDILDWLSIPESQRKRMYEEFLKNETDKQNGTA